MKKPQHESVHFGFIDEVGSDNLAHDPEVQIRDENGRKIVRVQTTRECAAKWGKHLYRKVVITIATCE